jgi:hypothetical protein
MARRREIRNPLFAKRWFSDDVIVLCVRWYLRYKLSYRDLSEIMSELGVRIAPCTICGIKLSRTRNVAQRKHSFVRRSSVMANAVDHPRWFRAMPCSIAADGHAQRVQLSLGQPGEGSLLSILEQHSGDGAITNDKFCWVRRT